MREKKRRERKEKKIKEREKDKGKRKRKRKKERKGDISTDDNTPSLILLKNLSCRVRNVDVAWKQATLYHASERTGGILKGHNANFTFPYQPPHNTQLWLFKTNEERTNEKTSGEEKES